MTMQQYCLRWNNHQPNFISVFSSLLNNESLVDVTLAAEGRHLQAHKVVLSACSSYFQTLFTINPCQHPIVILKDVKFLDLKVMVDFMYYGEVNVSHDQLPHILKTAEMLKIKGLAEIPVEQSALTKSQSSSTERADLLTPGDSNWSSDEVQQQSLSPSPCSLSPSSKRRRLRKTSTGSGSESTERTSEEHAHGEIAAVPSPVTTNTLTTVIKPDPGSFVGDSSTSVRIKQQTNESELQRVGVHTNVEEDTPHQITLQIPSQDAQHKTDATLEIAGPSNIPQTTSTGYQWGIVDGSYPRFTLSTCQSNISTSTDMNYNAAALPQPMIENNITQLNEASTTTINSAHLTSPSGTQIMQKRKRSINPQSDEKFVRALEAVRFGGIGFCKAAKMYGVNNRTLWLEYKKRGYPNSRISIKNRKHDYLDTSTSKQDPTSPIATASSDQENEVLCGSVNQQGSTINNESFIDNRHVDLSPILARPRYLDMVNVNTQHTLGFQGVTFEQM